MVAALANTQNATAVAAAMIWWTTSVLPKKSLKPLCAHPDVAAAAIASTSAMIDFHGLVFLHYGHLRRQVNLRPACTCIQQVLPTGRT